MESPVAIWKSWEGKPQDVVYQHRAAQSHAAGASLSIRRTAERSLMFLVLLALTLGLEIYRTIIQTLQGVAWALLVFFVVALIAFEIIRRGEAKQGRSV